MTMQRYVVITLEQAHLLASAIEQNGARDAIVWSRRISSRPPSSKTARAMLSSRRFASA